MTGCFSARRCVALIVAAVAVLGLATSAAIAKPFEPVAPSPATPATTAPTAPTGPHLSVSAVSSAPADSRAGGHYVLHGSVANDGSAAATRAVTVRLLRHGSAPTVLGSARVSVPAGGRRAYRAAIVVPAGLDHGSYQLVACVPRGDQSGALGCATAHRGFDVGAADPVRGAKVQLAAPTANTATCSSGSHTLSQPGDHIYPEMGNGGYTSIHTNVNLVYDAEENEFLEGNNVELTQTATQCLSDFSLDFALKTPDSEEGPGSNLNIESVTVDGLPATFEFVQPTYPGDPNGENDPDPLAHQTGQDTPVSATNPLPPACAPESPAAAANGLPCPANKMVITPAEPIANGATFEVKINYTGHPGVYTDGDGAAEGWFLVENDGGFVTTEPVGSMAWMPLNNHPSAKPTYDFVSQVTLGRTAISNGELIGSIDNPPDANFPAGSTTWRWHSPEPIANYLVENSVGSFDLSERLAGDGTLYYEAQSSALDPARKAENKEVMDQQEDITAFQERFNGPYPFSSNGIVIGTTEASFEEEMQGKITFIEGEIALNVLNHENMHMWFGDNVSESNFNETFFKEGMARLSEYLFDARNAATAAGGLDTPAGEAAFEASLTARFAKNYGEDGRRHQQWTLAPSNPTPASVFGRSEVTYNRPATAYIALRQILGKDNFASALQQIQQDFGGGSIEENQLEAEFHHWMPNQSQACHSRLNRFFNEWFDTEFPATGGASALRPQLTGPGLVPSASGTTFYNADGSCKSTAAVTKPETTASVVPAPADGKVTGPATVVLTASDGGVGVVSTEFSLDGGPFQAYVGPLTIAALGDHKIEYRSTNRDGGVEATKQLTFTVVAPAKPPVPTPVCAQPHLAVKVLRPLRSKHGVATLVRGKAYRYSGRLTCGAAGTPAPAGTVIAVSSVVGGHTVSQPGVTVGGNGKIDTLLQYSSKRTVVFGFSEAGTTAQAQVRIAVVRH